MRFKRLYVCLLTITAPVFLFYWLIQAFKHNVPFSRIKERFGYIPSLPKEAIWIHAASIGELRVANLIKSYLGDQNPIIISSATCRGITTTQTDFFLPYDHPWCVKRVYQTLKPKALILIETEIWPILIEQATCPVYLANARLSERSFKRYKMIQGLIEPAFAKLNGVWSSAKEDAQRLQSLGSKEAHTHPNVKYLDVQKPLNPLSKDENILVLSCTHPGEERILKPLIKQILKKNNHAQFVIIPRHAHRKKALQKLFCDLNDHICIEDRPGYTHHWYAKAQTVFMGGSLVPHGGHNPIEPLAYGCRTLVGPFYHNFTLVTDALLGESLVQLVTKDSFVDLCLKGHQQPCAWPFLLKQQKYVVKSLNHMTQTIIKKIT